GYQANQDSQGPWPRHSFTFIVVLSCAVEREQDAGQTDERPTTARRLNERYAVPQAMALRSRARYAAFSHGARNTGCPSTTGLPSREAGLWQWPSAKYVTSPLPIARV